MLDITYFNDHTNIVKLHKLSPSGPGLWQTNKLTKIRNFTDKIYTSG